jgi:hypothetical protein
MWKELRQQKMRRSTRGRMTALGKKQLSDTHPLSP